MQCVMLKVRHERVQSKRISKDLHLHSFATFSKHVTSDSSFSSLREAQPSFQTPQFRHTEEFKVSISSFCPDQSGNGSSHHDRHSRSGWTGLWAPDGAIGVPVYCRELDQMVFNEPFQLKGFHDSKCTLLWRHIWGTPGEADLAGMDLVSYHCNPLHSTDGLQRAQCNYQWVNCSLEISVNC